MIRHIRLILSKELLVMRRDRRMMAALLMSALIFPVLASMILRVGRPHSGERTPVLVEGKPGLLVRLALASSGDLEEYTDSSTVAALGRPYITLRIEGPNYTIFGDATKPAWKRAVALDEALKQKREAAVAHRLSQMGLSFDALSPFRLELVDTSSERTRSSAFFGFLLPYLAVVLLVTSVTRTVHIPAGEKETNTLGALLIARVPRSALVVGKTLAILIFAVTTAVLLFAGMAVLVYLGVLQPPGGESVSASLTWTQVGLVFLNLSSVALLLSSILMAIGTFARSQREAGLYASPLVILTMFLVVFALSGATFGTPVYAIPLLGNVLGMRDTIMANANWTTMLPVLSDTLAFLAFTGLSTWMYRREEVLFRS